MPMVNAGQHMNKAVTVRSMRYFKSPVTVLKNLNRPDKTNMITNDKFRGDR